MKSHELVERINNGEIKDGTKIEFRLTRKEPAYIYYRNKNLVYGEKSNGAGQFVDIGLLLDSNFEFEIVEEHKGWFKPKMGETYWYKRGCEFTSTDWQGWVMDEDNYKEHNCFRNIEELDECNEYRKALKEAEKPFEYNKTNYCLAYNKQCNDLTTAFDCHYKIQGITYLGTDKAVAQDFIEKWKKQILKFEFDVWE